MQALSDLTRGLLPLWLERREAVDSVAQFRFYGANLPHVALCSVTSSELACCLFFQCLSVGIQSDCQPLQPLQPFKFNSDFWEGMETMVMPKSCTVALQIGSLLQPSSVAVFRGSNAKEQRPID
ncbi:hypothetical protein AAG906_004303 [Vitis piasezkii]